MLFEPHKKAKKALGDLSRLRPAGSHTVPLTSKDVRIAREYIAAYWPHLERYHPKNEDSLLGLPNTYLVPAYEEGHEFDFNEMYYWDSYFMVQGMYDQEHKKLVTGILENLLYTFKSQKVIPNASRMYLTGRSQPPFLTTFIWEVYDNFKMSTEWLKKAMATAEMEYATVWMGNRKPHHRLVYEGLSRYYDINYLHDLAEAESGWDMTPRFNRKALDYLPVDLNALLYKYEVDFARYYDHVKNTERATFWRDAATFRAETMQKLMWDKSRNLFFDYNYKTKKRGSVASLAAFYPMWAGMIDDEQAAKLVKSLKKFEHKGGLTTTDSSLLGQFVPEQFLPGGVPTQWAYPNGWAPLHYLVVKGLQRYGYDSEAKTIATKWLRTNLAWFNEHLVFLEKYNVVDPDKPPMKGVYPSMTGFGWTNAVFERFCREFIDTV